MIYFVGKKWSVASIKCLLLSYKENKNLFNSPMRADAVYRKIVDDLEINGLQGFTVQQVRAKFAKLKLQYTAVKDNNKKSGAARLEFQFMDEFDDIFPDDLGISPTRLLSSRRDYEPRVEQEIEENMDSAEDATVVPKKSKLTHSEKVMEFLKDTQVMKQQHHDEREKGKNERNEERKRQRDDTIQAMKEGNEAVREGNNIFKDMLANLVNNIK